MAATGHAGPAAAAPADEAAFIAAIQAVRAENGLEALTVSTEITDSARAWSARMASDDRLYHNPNLATDVTLDWARLTENVGIGPGVDPIHEAFLASPKHFANIVDPKVTHVGVGVVWNGPKLWVTEDFVRLRSSA
ncbi:MAG: CAP domain-containing protein, partial [Acidimicrobiales bacterium]